MTALYPQLSVGKRSGATNIGETITASSTINPKGAWVELLAATTFDAFMVYVKCFDPRITATDTSLLVDIGFDPAGGTTYGVLISNVLMGFGSGDTSVHQDFAIPAYIPTGSTVAARIQSVISSETCFVAIAIGGGIPTDNPFPATGLVVTYGAATADSGGTALVDADANVESAWVELTGATTHPHRGVAISLQGNTDTMSTGRFLLDIASGAAASEVVISENIYITTGGGEIVGNKFPPNYIHAVRIPEGTRLAVRSMYTSNQNNATCDVALHGWG